MRSLSLAWISICLLVPTARAASSYRTVPELLNGLAQTQEIPTRARMLTAFLAEDPWIPTPERRGADLDQLFQEISTTLVGLSQTRAVHRLGEIPPVAATDSVELATELVRRATQYARAHQLSPEAPLWEAYRRVLNPAPGVFAEPQTLVRVLSDLILLAESQGGLPQDPALTDTLFRISGLGRGLSRTSAPARIRTQVPELEAVSRMQMARGRALEALGILRESHADPTIVNILRDALRPDNTREEKEGAIRGLFAVIEARRKSRPALTAAASSARAPAPIALTRAGARDQDLVALLGELQGLGANAEMRGLAFHAIWSRQSGADPDPHTGVNEPRLQAELVDVLAQLMRALSHGPATEGGGKPAALSAISLRALTPAAEMGLKPRDDLAVFSEAALTASHPTPLHEPSAQERDPDLAARIIELLPNRGLNRTPSTSLVWNQLANALRLDGPSDRIKAAAVALYQSNPPLERPDLQEALGRVATFTPAFDHGFSADRPPPSLITIFGEYLAAQRYAHRIFQRFAERFCEVSGLAHAVSAHPHTVPIKGLLGP